MNQTIFLFLLFVGLVQAGFAQKVVAGGYQVQNKATGLLLRPMDANGADGTPIVVYPKTTWRCLTWELKPSKDSGRFMVENYFTSKSFKANELKEGAAVTEIALDAKNGSPSYKFVETGNGYYRIEAASGLVLTAEGDGVNAKVVLKKWKNEPQQLWKLLPKPDEFTG